MRQTKVKIKYFIIMLLLIMICMMSSQTFATTIDLQTSKINAKPYEKIIVNINSIDATGRLDITVNNGTTLQNKIWVENDTISIAIITGKPGITKILVKGEISNDKGVEKIISEYITINVQDYTKGDINKDGRVNLSDVTYGLKGISKGTLTVEEKKIGDVTGDNKCNLRDIIKILQFIAGKIKNL